MREASAEALLLLAYLYTAHHRHAKAFILLRGLAELRPDDPRVLRPLAYACLREQRHAEALDLCERLLGPAGGPPVGETLACTLRLKAAALWGMGNQAEARRLLEESGEIHGETPPSRTPPAGA